MSVTLEEARAPTDLRVANLVRVFDLVLEHGPVSRSELARASGLGIPTVHRLVSELSQAGLLAQLDDPGEVPLGRPPAVFGIPDGALSVAGADIGNETTRCAVIDAGGRVRATRTLATAGCGDDLPDWLIGQIKSLMTDAGLPLGGLVACGVGIAAAVDPRRGVLLKPPLHHQWHGLPLVEELSGRLDCEFVVGQDDHFAALAEYSEIGTAPGASPLVVLAIGKGLGVGLTIDGRTVVGAHGRLGRIAGWPVTTPAPGAPTPPILGDALVSDGLVAAYRSIGGGTSVHDGQSLAVAARSGDQAAQRVIDWATGEIAEVIRRICVLTDPERVVLGGGIAAGSFDLLLSGLAEHLGDTAGLLAASVLGSGAVLTGGLLEAERAAGPRVRERITAGEPAARHTPTIA